MKTDEGNIFLYLVTEKHSIYQKISQSSQCFLESLKSTSEKHIKIGCTHFYAELSLFNLIFVFTFSFNIIFHLFTVNHRISYIMDAPINLSLFVQVLFIDSHIYLVEEEFLVSSMFQKVKGKKYKVGPKLSQI